MTLCVIERNYAVENPDSRDRYFGAMPQLGGGQ